MKVAVQSPISTPIGLYATCVAPSVSATSLTPTSTPSAGDMYDGSYKWYGNGSIMSKHFEGFYNRRNDNVGNAWPYGAFIDYFASYGRRAD